MKDKDFTKCAEIKVLASPNQIIINGVPTQQTTTVLSCPTCGKILASIGDNIQESDAWKICTANKQQFMQMLNYCSICSQKLSFPEIILTQS